MKIYKIAFRNPLDTITNTLAKEISSKVRRLEERGKITKEYLNNYSSKENLNYDGIKTNLAYIIKIEVIDAYMNPPYLIEAEYTISERKFGNIVLEAIREITISIKFSPSFDYNSYNDFYMNAVNVIRHELQHYADDLNGILSPQYSIEGLRSKDIKIKFESMAQYLIDQTEQVPFIKGFMLQSKKRNVPINDNITQFIHEQLFSNNKREEQLIRKTVGETMAEHVERQIVDIYLKRIKEIFPNAK
jgi:hypothetical protein